MVAQDKDNNTIQKQWNFFIRKYDNNATRKVALNDRYELTEIISDNGFVTLYKALDIQTYKNVIIRRYTNNHIKAETREAIKANFKREIEILSSIEHENLENIIDCFISPQELFGKDYYYIVSDEVKGKTLRDVIKEKQLSYNEYVDIMVKVCEGLKTLSQEDYIFYTLNPDDIIIGENNEVKLTNYPIYRLFKSGTFENNLYMGIPGYAAPEQYGAKPVDNKSLIFSAGTLLYYIFTGCDPAENPLSFKSVKQENPDISIKFSRIISKCTKLKPEERYSSISALIDDMETTSPLEISLPDMIKKKIEEEIIHKTSRLVEENKFAQMLYWYFLKYTNQILIFGSIIVISLIILTGMFLFASRQEKNNPQLFILGGNNNKLLSVSAVNPGLKEQVDMGLKHKISGNGILSHDNKYIYMTSMPDLVVCFDLLKNSATDIKVGKIPEGMALSPGQNYLAVSSTGSDNITIIDTVYNTPVATLKSGGQKPVSLSFSSDGNELFVLNKISRQVTSMELTGNINQQIPIDGEGMDIINTGANNKLCVTLWDKNELLILSSASKNILSKIALPQGPSEMALCQSKDLVAIICKKSNTVVLFSVRTDKITERLKIPGVPSSAVFSKDGKELYIGVTNFDQTISDIYLWNGKDLKKIAHTPVMPFSLIYLKK